LVGRSKSIVLENSLRNRVVKCTSFLACGYVLGNSMTLADVDFMSTYSTLEACNFINLDCFKNLKMWADRMKQQIPKYSENCGKGAEAFGNWFNSNFDRKQA